MSEYQYYRFERLNGCLSANQRQALCSISSRAEITHTSFSVFYHYSDLKAEPVEVMQNYFDIGFYYANWGNIDAYIKLPLGTLPDAFLAVADDYNLTVYSSDDAQLLIFSLEEYYEYFDDEDADSFFQYLAELREELIAGDYRLLYFPWLKRTQHDDKAVPLPLIHFDFKKLTPAQLAFVALFDLPTVSIRALALLLREAPSHTDTKAVLTPADWVGQLSVANKDNLLCELFKSGHLSRSQALSLIKKQQNTQASDFQYWLVPSMLETYTGLAAQQIEQEKLQAEEQRIEQARITKENQLNQRYLERDAVWSRVEKEASRACASGYDNASALLHELSEAYSFKSEQSTFSTSYQRFVRRHQNRKALLRRLEPITAQIAS